MIPGVCPECGVARPLPDFLADAEARAALAAALDCPAGLARLIVPYLQLHAPAGRRVAMGKLARLLRELTARVTAGTVQRGRETLPAPPEAWAHGLEEVLAAREAGTLVLPLSGHGYLDEVVFRTQAKAVAQGRRAATPLHPSHQPAVAAPAAVPGTAAASERQELMSRRSGLERLHVTTSGALAAALRAQIAAVDARLRALGVPRGDAGAGEEHADDAPA